MSELMNASARGFYFRGNLLATVSAAVLAAIASDRSVQAQERDKPSVWIELGGQLEHQTIEPPFAPPFAQAPPPDFENPPPLVAQRSPRYAYGIEGKLSFSPEGSDWLLSAAIRYGRSNGNKRVHQSGPHITVAIPPITTTIRSPVQFADTTAQHDESHSVLDFQVGRDVGLGMFGGHAQSQISAGVRFAQFNTKSTVAISSIPDLKIVDNPLYSLVFPLKYYHIHSAASSVARSFRGVGPSLSWSGSVSIAGNGEGGEVALDFGLNGAVLFGRQKTRVHHFTHAEYYIQKYHYNPYLGKDPDILLYDRHPSDRSRSRSATVPDLGGFAGLSFRYANAKVSFGYRGEIFFGAMDDGFDAAHSGDRSFHGPFATISIGLGG